MPDRQINDESALRSLAPVIEALKASISMQKAVANHFAALEALRTFGYSNGFISAALSNGSGKTIPAGLLASMMYRARIKAAKSNAPVTKQWSPAPAQLELGTTQKPEHTPHPFAQLSNRTGDRRRDEFNYNPTPDLKAIYGDGSPE